MPGIVGIIETPKRVGASAVVDRMLSSISREPWHNYGVYADEDLGLYVGWVNNMGSFSDCLPIWNAQRNVCLLIVGEAFVDPNDNCCSHTDGRGFRYDNAHYLMALYESLGTAFLSKLSGTFCGVIVDLRLRQATVFNDRFGLSRLYFHESGDRFYFASEAKALLKVVPHTRRFDPQGLGEVCSVGCALQSRTLFSGIFLVPPASIWRFVDGRSGERERYFNATSWEAQSLQDEEQFYNDLRDVFHRVLPRYFVGLQPIAMSLTGGLDGRMIMAAARRDPGTFPCYTFGGTYRDCADVQLARAVARECRQHHQTISVGSGFLSQFGALASKAVYVSDGAMDVTAAVNLYANQIAREIAPVRLTGNYGSEILRSNVAFRPGGCSEELFAPDLIPFIRNAANTYAAEAKGNLLTFIAFKQVPWHHCSLFAVEQSQITTRSPFLDADLVRLMYRAPIALRASAVPSLRLIADGNPALGKLPTDRGIVLRPTPVITAAKKALQKLTLKAEYAYDSGMPHWLARFDRALSPLPLEKLFLGHHKFSHFRVWYRNELSEYLRDVLLDPQTLGRGHFDRRFLQKMVDQHIRGEANYTDELHRALTLELTQRTLVELN